MDDNLKENRECDVCREQASKHPLLYLPMRRVSLSILSSQEVHVEELFGAKSSILSAKQQHKHWINNHKRNWRCRGLELVTGIMYGRSISLAKGQKKQTISSDR
jgi:hypothetical protein